MENWTPESGFCWKKHRRDALFLKINKSKETYGSPYFTRRWRRPKGEAETAPGEPKPQAGAVGPPAAPPGGLEAQGHPSRSPFVYLTLGTLTHKGRPSKYSAASTRRKTPESEKLPCRKKSAGGNSLPEGEIVAIITVIELDFIGIIIIIISTANTIITAAALRLRYNI